MHVSESKTDFGEHLSHASDQQRTASDEGKQCARASPVRASSARARGCPAPPIGPVRTTEPVAKPKTHTDEGKFYLKKITILCFLYTHF